MHAKYFFLIDPLDMQDIESYHDLSDDVIRESWITEQTLQFAQEKIDEGVNENDPKSVANTPDQVRETYRRQLEAEWEAMADAPKEAIRRQERLKAQAQDLADEVSGIYEMDYEAHYCGEDNWAHPLVAILTDGRIVNLAEDDWDPECRKFAYHYLAMPQEERWTYALTRSLAFIATDAYVPNVRQHAVGDPSKDDERIDSMTAEELMAFLTDYIPRYMIRELDSYKEQVIRYHKLTDYPEVDITKESANDNDGEIDDYKLRAARQLFYSWRNRTFAGFSDNIENPDYNYRVTDLRYHEPDEEGNPPDRTQLKPLSMIMIVDIHT